MVRLRLLGAIALASTLMIGSGCIFGGGSSPDAGSDTAATDASGDTTRSETGLDDAETDRDTPAEKCSAEGDCTDENGAVYTCEMGTCQMSACQTDYEDLDDDPSNGCECNADDIATYLKDGDGDGHPGDGADSETACEEPGEDWVPESEAGDPDCDDEDASVHPGVDDNEKWRCDGTDNDCDGNDDEVCCEMGDGPDGPPSPVQIGSKDNDQANPVMVPAIDEAPGEAAYLVAWSEGDTLKLQHVDADGKAVASNGNGTFPISSGIEDFAVVGVADEYAIAFADGAGVLSLGTLTGQLKETEQTISPSDVDSTRDDKQAIGEVSMTPGTDAETVWLAYSRQTDSGHQLVATSVELQTDESGSLDPERIDLLDNDLLPNMGAPEITIVDGTPMVAWQRVPANPLEARIQVARIAEGGVGQRFEVDVTATQSKTAESIELVGLPDKGVVLYPDFAEGEGALQMVAVSADGLGDGSRVTGKDKPDRQPSATPVDRDGDGEADHLLVVWARGKATDPDIVVGRLSLEADEPDEMAEKMVAKANDREWRDPTVGRRDGRGAVSFLQTNQVAKHDVKYAPLSIDGAAICQ